jgi:hypothetical protein
MGQKRAQNADMGESPRGTATKRQADDRAANTAETWFVTAAPFWLRPINNSSKRKLPTLPAILGAATPSCQTIDHSSFTRCIGHLGVDYDCMSTPERLLMSRLSRGCGPARAERRGISVKA